MMNCNVSDTEDDFTCSLCICCRENTLRYNSVEGESQQAGKYQTSSSKRYFHTHFEGLYSQNI